jgi:hypothetical protein
VCACVRKREKESWRCAYIPSVLALMVLVVEEEESRSKGGCDCVCVCEWKKE